MLGLKARDSASQERIRDILDGRDKSLGYWVALALHGLILLTAIAFAVSTVPELPEHARIILTWFERIAVAIFMFEYFLRIFAAKHPMHYIVSFWGIIDLLAWMPSLFMTAGGTVALRLLRLMQMVRILKVIRYSRALQRLSRAFVSVHAELALFYIIALFLIYISAVGIYFFEHEVQPEIFTSVPASLWWAIVTLTTVGYGDAIPVTLGGKLFTSLILFMGMGVFAVPAGVITSALVGHEIEDIEESLEKIESSAEEKAYRDRLRRSKSND
ncbi:MlotiK1 channel [Thalassovita gelatinovora]|uniref:MlotiK1 channel n=1 Tax=Thalassovita gelatinovora TaxID=53501 RepID=A0A0P1FIP3_THAGE|nr:ion transporter [Thalassovita gelatinovora]QIZ82203.1 ion transporter [Thalassovita gelatinovora]CUH67832.1 MlotiK1 channel [Thalassovita gelatinovora]SEP66300.1 voltage-gated potassium channel [Thalassovita gelatinovora]